jgi:hypothetical protein
MHPTYPLISILLFRYSNNLLHYEKYVPCHMIPLLNDIERRKGIGGEGVREQRNEEEDEDEDECRA